MGWFWGSSDDKAPTSQGDDPLRNLDPSLRDFLKKESPEKYESTHSPASPASPAPRVIPEPTTPAAELHPAKSTQPEVPPQSLYQDGRYAQLWKNYKPQGEVEAEGKSDQEKMMDVLDGYKSRKAQIGRVALENCALEQLEVSDCFRKGGWSAKATMCRTENRKFERCYMMQAKFLKALGYLTSYESSPEVNERIQMQADALYHQMLDHEIVVENAKAEGKPIPSFASLVKAKVATSEDGEKKVPTEISDLTPRAQAAAKKQLEKLKGGERELEEIAMKAEIAAGVKVSGKVEELERQQEIERKIRKEQGRETMADKVYYAFRAK